VFDKAFTDYGWFGTLVEKGIFFVVRQKVNAQYRVIERHPTTKSKGILCDQTILLAGQKSDRCPYSLRRIRYRDQKTGKDYVYITNATHISVRTVADIYKNRWQIELFFKWIKQNLKIKSFLGTSKNAVLTQIWIAISVYLILCWIKFNNDPPPAGAGGFLDHNVNCSCPLSSFS
jgi:putative transposase